MAIVPIKNGINFRDLGGIKAQDGRKVKSGLLFRSGALSQLSENETQFLGDKFPAAAILDYRDQSEIDMRPDVLWQSARYYHFPANPVLTDVSADLEKELNNNIKGTDLKKSYPSDFMVKLYRLLPFNNPAYTQLVSLLKTDDHSAVIQHCAVGKDRTGVGVALTLFALGADEVTVMDDYLYTEKALAEFREKLLKEFATQLTEEELESHRNLFAAKEEYLDAALVTIKNKYQTIDRWLEHEYGLNQSAREKLQTKYLD
ncbi:tyrosine-protein phosphatase [Zophobihabitans entericus]|uniref:Tyrosine-protein phosphatase n=1 Tax=Zophobihabitans entericus TaxID=1635327 RepID=A0A6G9IA17_9GAMM|nr:tyrosine-protein phosphatase [Zophobihabitans entericus]QIQ20677.1 tyrosine-protein phosphatase [Zophobihabitans entericus]